MFIYIYRLVIIYRGQCFLKRYCYFFVYFCRNNCVDMYMVDSIFFIYEYVVDWYIYIENVIGFQIQIIV